MTPDEADRLIRKIQYLGEKVTEMQAQRTQLIALFRTGRTEGTDLACRVTAPGTLRRPSVTLLRGCVAPEILKACSVEYRIPARFRVVPKKKRKEPDHA